MGRVWCRGGGNKAQFVWQPFDIETSLKKIKCMYEASGKIKLINDTQTFPSGFSKREFVVTTSDSKYPQDIKFEVIKDKCDILDDYEEGQDVSVNFDIRGNEYQGKYYVNLACWKLSAAEGAGGDSSKEGGKSDKAGAGNAEPSAADLRKDDDFDDDDIPF